MKTRGWSTRR